MIRTTLTPVNRDVHISIPQDYVGRKVQVLLYAEDEPEDVHTEKATTMARFWGVISKEEAEDMQKHIAKSREEWEKDI